MSETGTTTAARRDSSLLVRGAEPADHEAIRGVVLGAHARHAGQLAPEVFSRYLAGQLDLGTHASYGRLLVAGTQQGVLGFAAFYPDASVPGSGFPSGWAEVRVLAVHPGVRCAIPYERGIGGWRVTLSPCSISSFAPSAPSVPAFPAP